jgi:hypothetical protein
MNGAPNPRRRKVIDPGQTLNLRIPLEQAACQRRCYYEELLASEQKRRALVGLLANLVAFILPLVYAFSFIFLLGLCSRQLLGSLRVIVTPERAWPRASSFANVGRQFGHRRVLGDGPLGGSLKSETQSSTVVSLDPSNAAAGVHAYPR